MATYIAVVSLMQDLEQYLNSYDHVFGSDFRPFTKKEIEILYHAVSSMDSFLRDSSGQSYNHEFMSHALEKRIRDVVLEAGDYVDFLAVQSSADQRFAMGKAEIDIFLSKITEKMGCIHEKINDDKNGQDIEDTTSTGKITCPSKIQALILTSRG